MSLSKISAPIGMSELQLHVKMYVYDISPLNAAQVKNPRTAVCTKTDGTTLLITVDGRADDSTGMTVPEFAAYTQVRLTGQLVCTFITRVGIGAHATMFPVQKVAYRMFFFTDQTAGWIVQERV